MAFGRLLPTLVVLMASQASLANSSLQRLISNQFNGVSAECARLLNWSTEALSADVGQRMSSNSLNAAVSDELFTRHFGKPYDQLTLENFRAFEGVWRECQRDRAHSPDQRSLIMGAWNARQHARLAGQLAKTRALQSEFDAAVSELPALPATLPGLQRFKQIEVRGKEFASLITPDRFSIFQTRLADARQRVAVPMERQLAVADINAAEGAAGLVRLHKLRGDWAQSGLPASLVTELNQLSEQRMAQLLPAVLDEERRSLSQWPLSADGLVVSAAWVRDFDKRFAGVIPQAPPLAALRQEVMAQRLKQVAVHKDAVLAAIQRTRDSDALKRWSDAFLPEEQGTGAVAELLSAAQQRTKLLQSLQRDIALFGEQPEHDALLRGTSPHASATSARKAQPHRCDTLGAHPSDPDRVTSGVSDEQLDGAAVAKACEEAVRQDPKQGRFHMQRGRGLLATQRMNEAVAALQTGAKLNNAAAYYYLSQAQRLGVGGLRKDESKAQSLMDRADALGFGGEPRVAHSATTSARGVLQDEQDLAAHYEFGHLMRAVYWGESNRLSGRPMFIYAYLLGQGHGLAQLCSTFKLSELNDYQDNLTRMGIPASLGAVFNPNNIMSLFNQAMQIASNPRLAVDASRGERDQAMAGEYGVKDLATFTKSHASGCNDPVMQRYTRNLRSYLRNAGG